MAYRCNHLPREISNTPSHQVFKARAADRRATQLKAKGRLHAVILRRSSVSRTVLQLRSDDHKWSLLTLKKKSTVTFLVMVKTPSRSCSSAQPLEMVNSVTALHQEPVSFPSRTNRLRARGRGRLDSWHLGTNFSPLLPVGSSWKNCKKPSRTLVKPLPPKTSAARQWQGLYKKERKMGLIRIPPQTVATAWSL